MVYLLASSVHLYRFLRSYDCYFLIVARHPDGVSVMAMTFFASYRGF